MTTHYHRRRNNMRLPYYDYSQNGCYFVTICTKNRNCLLSNIINGKVQLSEIGVMIEETLKNLLNDYPQSEFSNYVIMPNHLHFIWFNQDNVLLSDLVRKLKGITAKKYREMMNNQICESLWQRSFYEHIIRNDEDFLRIWEYIENNPLQWYLDRFYQ
ncbi:REP-associated tyrosine transposase [Ursidibacter sp. B-7004-1]